MSTEPRLYVITYDIGSPRRWRRVYRALRRHGAWQQLSAFVCRLTPKNLARLESDLLKHMDPICDRLMIVDLGEGTDAEARLRRYGQGEPLPRATVRIL
jgi:CRISPR-associated protein Cas2